MVVRPWTLRALLMLFPACGLGCPPPPAAPEPQRAFGDASLAQRIGSIESQILAGGGEIAARFGPTFLMSGRQSAQPLELAGGQCWLLVGLAGTRIADLDLALFAVDGRRLDVDEERDAHPVLARCLDEDVRAVAVTLAYEGDGETFLGVYRFPEGSDVRRGDLRFDEAPAPGPESNGESREDTLLRATRQMQALGFHPLDESEDVELAANGEVDRTRHLQAGRCLGVALVGDETAEDLDLVFRIGSRAVAEDSAESRDAHAEYCSDDDVDVRVVARSARAAAGGTLIYFEAAPEERVFVTPSELPDEPRPDLPGGEQAFEQLLQDQDRRMRDGGYEPVGEPFEGSIGSGEPAVDQLQLVRGSCYEIVGLARPGGIADLDLMLDDAVGNRVAEDRLETNDPRLSFCPEVTGSYLLSVDAYDGAGDFVVNIYRLGGATREIPGIGGRMAAAYGLMAAELWLKGFHPVGTPDRRPAEAGRQTSHPLDLHFGSCYAITAVASDDNMDVDLEVRDYLLRSVAVDVGGEPDARVFVCPDRTAPYYATVTVSGAAGQYMLTVFESKEE
ncbi:MAG: hypothetical protein HY905_22830 [Deltaproteobacteria bacterium]|nr:hypothetical protein [Deltaproteobacteria bacterium]